MSIADERSGGTSGTITSTSTGSGSGSSGSGGSSIFDDLISPFKEDDGSYDYGKIIGTGTAALGAIDQVGSLFGFDVFGSGGGRSQPMGYQGGIPTYTASRMQVPGTYDPNRRPGSGGQRYFTDVRFNGSDTSEQAAGLQALNRANLAAQDRQGQPLAPIRAAEDAAAAEAAAQAALAAQTPQPTVQPVQPTQQMAAGGIAQLKRGRFLDGDTDGMADKKPAMIDNEQPAMLSDGEFVIPADVVSHLGNGNSEAGAKVLEDMMDRVRKARTGSEKQGKEIDPKDFLPV